MVPEGLNGVGGKTKGSLKRWSSVGRASVSYEDFEMGCDAEREDDLHSIGSSKRFKLPNKVGFALLPIFMTTAADLNSWIYLL